MQVKCTRSVLSLLATTAYHSHVDRRGLGIEVNPNELLPGFEGESRDLAQIRNFMRKSSITTNGREQHISVAPLQPVAMKTIFFHLLSSHGGRKWPRIWRCRCGVVCDI